MKTAFFSTILLCLALCIDQVNAQARRSGADSGPAIEDLPQFAIDTLDTPDRDTKIILYSNNTWSYYRPSLSERYDHLSVYTENWNNDQIFSYPSVHFEDIPQSIDIKLFAAMEEFHPPIVGKVFSKFGPRGRRRHNGVDIPLKVGEPIYATFDGRVRYAKWNTGGYGYLIIVRHPNGLETWYAHLSKLNVEPNDYVKAGEIIGYGGNTGRSHGPHLHFEMRYCDQTFDPERILDFENGQIKYQTFALQKSYFNINSRASDQLEEHDQFDNYAFASGEDGQPVTSEEIVSRIQSGATASVATRSTASSSTQATVSQGDAVYHKIASGDMLGKIAIKYGVSIDQICRLNGITRNTTLRIGKTLRVK